MWLRRGAIALLLVALTFAVFSQVRHHRFVDFDDYVFILVNETLEASSPGEAIRVAFTTQSLANWIPLTVLSYQLDRALFGTEPAGYLLENVALHALTSLLLFLALASMTGATGRSAFVAAVFAVHPLHVESVAWASERKDVLSGLFWMLTLAAHTAYSRRPESRGRYALSFACLVLGLLAKPMLVTLPFVLLLLDYWPLRRLGRRAVLEKVPMLAVVAAFCVVTLWVQRASGATDYGDTIPFELRLLNAIDSYAAYLVVSVWPTGLAPFYPHPMEELSLSSVGAEAALLLAATAAVFALRRSRPYLLVGWLWYLGTLVPVIGLLQVGLQARADRYMYLPLVGLGIAVAWGVHDLVRGRVGRRVLGAVACAAVAALAVAAWVQVGYWRESMALFERDLAIAPESYYPHRRLATLYMRQLRVEEAGYHARRVYEIEPERGRPALVLFHLAMADLEARRGDEESVLSHYREAVRVDPDHARANRLLGLALLARGEPREARPYLERALGDEPDDAQLHEALAGVASAEGRLGDAAEHQREVLRIDPENARARNNLAWLLATASDPTVRDPAEALRLAEELRHEPEGASANHLDTLAAAYAAAGRFAAALETAAEALRLAEEEGASTLATQIRNRLANYRSREPYTEPPMAASPSHSPREQP